MKDAVATMGAVLPDDASGRDAVHVAVVSCVAGEKLLPGQDIGLGPQAGNALGEQMAFANSETVKKIGIVDPFIKGVVWPGQRFWLYLYPRTITGLCHHWTHPDFADATPASARRLASEQWLRDFVARSDCPDYETTIALAVNHDGGEQYLLVRGSDAHGDIPPEFWDHVENVTGRKIAKERRATFFSCTC